MRAALLARVSTEAQEDRLSLPAQLRAMRDRCHREGWSITREFEGDESAFTSNLAKRPLLAEVLTAAENQEFDILVIHESSRLARDEAMAHEILNRLEKCKVRLVNVGSGIDYLSPEGRMFYGVEASLNAYWSRKMSEHIRKGMRERFERGLPMGDIPFGYRKGEPPTIIPEEAEAIRWAFEQYTTGKGHLAIATEFNKRGLKPRSKRGLIAFTPSSIQSILENRFYAGYVSHKAEERVGAHEPIISEEVWLSASLRTRRQGTHRSTTYDAQLVGLTTCHHCHGPVWSNKSGPRMHTYYWEPSRVRGRDCPAKGRKWRASEPDGIVIDAILGMRLGGKWTEAVYRMARVEAPDDRQRLIERKRRIGQAYTLGAIDDREFEEQVRMIDLQLAHSPAKIVSAGEKLTTITEFWSEATPEERNRIMRLILARVSVDILGKEVHLAPMPEFESFFDARRRYVCEGTGTPARSSGLFLPSELLEAA